MVQFHPAASEIHDRDENNEKKVKTDKNVDSLFKTRFYVKKSVDNRPSSALS